MSKSYSSLMLLGLLTLSLAVHGEPSPVGLWKTFDDDGGKPESLVRITQAGDILTGVIEDLFKAEERDALCEECKDYRRGLPVLGMTVITGVSRDSGEDNLWDGGKILDVKSGSEYKVRMKLGDAGNRLLLRGYIGMPLIGRTAEFERVE